MSAICHTFPGVVSRPRRNQTPPALRKLSRFLVSKRSTKKTRLASSLGDASFDFINESGAGDNKRKAKNPDLVPLSPDAPLPNSSSDPGLHAEHFDEEGNFGPLSLLAVGLDEAALASVARLLEDDLEAKGVVPSFLATAEMLHQDLRSSFAEASRLEGELCLFRNAHGENTASSSIAPRSSVERPAIVLSGMSSSEVLSVVAAWEESGCARRHAEVLFCAAVPGNWTGRTLKELIEDISGDAASVGA